MKPAFQIVKLTESFYHHYPAPPYNEILQKKDRPHCCLSVQMGHSCFLCIPYRTEIHHRYAYKFTSSQRSIAHKFGLDYTKMIIICQNNFIDTEPGILDQDEYIETIRHINKIFAEATQYVDDYIYHCLDIHCLHPAEFRRRYAYSTLPYFHSEPGISL